ncbi:NADPH-dependent F420 reductase [Mesorhizobium sp. VK3C]|nr:NADPH-dependent F420 reductase [Mesorhizobium sp. VK3C]MDX8449403.1 NADPH-dependent F420 reductase [Mesorhizobium sp. VK3C]
MVLKRRETVASPITASGRKNAMRIAIIGIGNVGSALARGFVRAGHQVVLGVRNAGDAKVSSLAQNTNAEVNSPSGAAASADVIVLALPWTAAEEAVRSLGNLKGKIVIDCMNPLAMRNGVLGLDRGFDTSGAEALANWIPDARIVKTLNQVGAELMADNSDLPHRPVMFMASNDAEAKAAVSALLTGLGFEALDAGDLTKARLLEPYGMVWINQALFRGQGRDWAFAAVKRT